VVYELILQGTRIYRDFYWSQRAIAHASGISVSTLKRVLHDLREAGLIASNYRHMDTCVYDAYESPNQARLRLRLKHDLHAIELQLMNIYLNGDNSATYWGNFRQKLGRSIITSEQVGDSTGKEREKMNVSEFIFANSLDIDKMRPLGRIPKAVLSHAYDQNQDLQSINSLNFVDLDQLHEESLRFLGLNQSTSLKTQQEDRGGFYA